MYTSVLFLCELSKNIYFVQGNSPASEVTTLMLTRGRILGGNWDKSLQSFPPCYSQSLLPTDFTPPPPWAKVGWNLLVIVNTEYSNWELSILCPRKPQQNCKIVCSWIRLQIKQIFLYIYNLYQRIQVHKKNCIAFSPSYTVIQWFQHLHGIHRQNAE